MHLNYFLGLFAFFLLLFSFNFVLVIPILIVYYQDFKNILHIFLYHHMMQIVSPL